MTWLAGLAEHVAGLGLGLVWRPPPGVYGDDEWGIVLGPPRIHPPRLVALTPYGGAEADSLLGWDEPNVQLRVRGSTDYTDSETVAQGIYDHLHGAGPLTLPDGTRLQLAVGLQSGPISLGYSDAGVHEHTVNLRVELRRATAHRT